MTAAPDDLTMSTQQAKLQNLAQVMHIHYCCGSCPPSHCQYALNCSIVETGYKQLTPNYQTMHNKGCNAMLRSSLGIIRYGCCLKWTQDIANVVIHTSSCHRGVRHKVSRVATCFVVCDTNGGIAMGMCVHHRVISQVWKANSPAPA